MAIYVLTNAAVIVNSGTLTDHVESVTVQMNADDIDITAMGATAHAHTPGLRDDKITVNFYQDFASGSVDATLNPTVGSALGGTIIVQSGTSVSSTQPKYTMPFVLLDYQPLDGKVGAASMTQVTFVPAAGGAITRGTS